MSSAVRFWKWTILDPDFYHIFIIQAIENNLTKIMDPEFASKKLILCVLKHPHTSWNFGIFNFLFRFVLPSLERWTCDKPIFHTKLFSYPSTFGSVFSRFVSLNWIPWHQRKGNHVFCNTNSSICNDIEAIHVNKKGNGTYVASISPVCAGVLIPYSLLHF